MLLGINPFYDDYYCYHNYKYQPIGILSVLATLRAAGYEAAFLDAQTNRRQQTRKPKELENTEGGYYRYGLGDKEYKAALMEYADSFCACEQTEAHMNVNSKTSRALMSTKQKPQVILMTSSMTFRWHSLRDAIALTKEVFPNVPIVYGCTRNCAHCASRLLYGGYKRRDAKEVIVEIDDRYNRHGVREFHLYDDDLLW